MAKTHTHTHKFRARPCSPADGKFGLDQSEDLTGEYTTAKNFFKFMLSRKGKKDQVYYVWEWCRTGCGEWALVKTYRRTVS